MVVAFEVLTESWHLVAHDC